MTQLTPEVSKLLEQALSLSVEEQEVLANTLYSILDRENTEPADAAVEQAWSEELKRRIDDIDSGKTKMIPYEEVRRRLAARLADAGK